MIEKRIIPRTPSGIDKRRFPRTPVENVTVEVCDAHGDPGIPEVCPILNISEAGMLFESLNEYPPSTRLRLTFMLPDSILIVRTSALAVHQFWKRRKGYVGVTFLNIGATERRAISAFVLKNQVS